MMAKVVKTSRLDLTGQTFGKWKVLEFSRMHPTMGKSLWVVQCCCKVVREVLGSNLTLGKSTDCGCGRRRTNIKSRRGKPALNRLPDGEAAFRNTVSTLKRSAQDRGIKMLLSLEEIKSLHQQTCYYCGGPPKQTRSGSQVWRGRKYDSGDYVYNGIDRVDSGGDYVSDNVVTCCIRCNRAKNAMPLEEFIDWVETVSTRLKEGMWGRR